MTKILVIEDEEALRVNLQVLLEAEDFQSVGAPNGRSGVELAREHLPDLILCDVMMPELDGYGVLAELRQDPVTATIPFIFLTARADKPALRQGMELAACRREHNGRRKTPLGRVFQVRIATYSPLVASKHPQTGAEISSPTGC